MTELTRAETHQQDIDDRGSIHDEDMSQVEQVSKALKLHIKENRQQFKKTSEHNMVVDRSLSGIKDTIDSWTPYISDGMKKSEAYKYVAEDLKSRSKNAKWWLTFAVLFISFMYYYFAVIEKFNK